MDEYCSAKHGITWLYFISISYISVTRKKLELNWLVLEKDTLKKVLYIYKKVLYIYIFKKKKKKKKKKKCVFNFHLIYTHFELLWL